MAINDVSNINLNMVSTKFSLHCFSAQIDEQTYKYDILKLNDSIMIFVNLKDAQQFDDLSYAVLNPQSTHITSIQIFGDFLNDQSRNLVHHLGKKLKKNIYLSLNVVGDRHLYSRIEQQLFEEIKNNLDKF